ncbi:unnamed protein product [Moneuplotes crassus]|uniref:Uncharacterized protein n=1 Tax=Euplotes crassus TaxID=5936 RepID=A0AAD1YAH7_EUPCR|nr:unnamed protein product [Moneuplotes crassus]
MKIKKHPCLYGKKPRRTLKILNKEESDSEDENIYLNRSKVDKDMRKRSDSLLSSKPKTRRQKHAVYGLVKEANGRYKKIAIKHSMSPKINTDDYIVFSSYQNGSKALKSEVNMSLKRLNAAIHGSCSPGRLKKTDDQFYTDNKLNFLLKKSSQLNRIMKHNQELTMNILDYETNPKDQEEAEKKPEIVRKFNKSTESALGKTATYVTKPTNISRFNENSRTKTNQGLAKTKLLNNSSEINYYKLLSNNLISKSQSRDSPKGFYSKTSKINSPEKASLNIERKYNPRRTKATLDSYTATSRKTSNQIPSSALSRSALKSKSKETPQKDNFNKMFYNKSQESSRENPFQLEEDTSARAVHGNFCVRNKESEETRLGEDTVVNLKNQLIRFHRIRYQKGDELLNKLDYLNREDLDKSRALRITKYNT